MYLQQIWRYPVKSMGGEKLPAVGLSVDGIEGDRMVQARAQTGRVVTSRTKPGLLAHKAAMGDAGEPLVDGNLWSSPAAAEAVRAAAGPSVKLVKSDDRFDILPLLVGTDGAFAEAGYDLRRFRPNLVIGGVEGLAERLWEGRRIRIGGAVIQAADLRGRCVMITYDPDTQVQDLNVLKRIVRDYEGTFCLNCSVLQGGLIREGDPVELING